MIFNLSRIEEGRIVGVDTYNYEPITKSNYAERVKDMETLAPEWKTLDFAPPSVIRLFDPDHYLHQEDSPYYLETDKHELKQILSEEEQSILNWSAISGCGRPDNVEKTAEMLIREAWEVVRLPLSCPGRDFVRDIESKLGYKFHDEYHCVQAFTHRSFTKKCKDAWKCKGVKENNQVLEFFGDSALNVTLSRLMELEYCHQYLQEGAKFGSNLYCDTDEGTLTKIRSKFVCKDYLAERCQALGFDKYIRNKGQDLSIDDLEDTLEAVIGAVAIDSGWCMDVLESVVSQALDIILPELSQYHETDYFDEVYRWTQKRFGVVPEVTIWNTDRKYPAGMWIYGCSISVPNPGVDSDDLSSTHEECKKEGMYNVGGGMWPADKEHTLITEDKVTCDNEGHSRGTAREAAARRLWTALNSMHVWKAKPSESGIVPELEKAVNQLQELWQKGYIEEPEYFFEDLDIVEGVEHLKSQGMAWYCEAQTGFEARNTAFGRTKAEAKKEAAYKVLEALMEI